MAWRVPPDQREQAVGWLRRRVPVTRAEFDELTDEARAQSFTVGGTQQLNVVQSVLDEIERAVVKGHKPETFHKRIREVLERDYVNQNSARLKTAYRTTAQTAYAAGQWNELQAKKATHPFVRYDATLDGKTTALCESLNGHVFRHDDPFLLTHWTPLHFNCRTGMRPTTTKQAMDVGWQPAPKNIAVAKGFGLAPPEREKWQPDETAYSPQAWAEYQRKQRQLEKQ